MWVFSMRGHEARNVGWIVLTVCVEGQDPFGAHTLCGRETGPQSAAFSAIGGVSQDGRSHLLGGLGGSIGGTIVDHDHRGNARCTHTADHIADPFRGLEGGHYGWN